MSEAATTQPAAPPQRRRPAPLIPPDTRRSAPLFFVVATLAFLACVAAVSARAAWRASVEWTSSLEASATVLILSEDAATADADAARAAEILSALSGVAEARALPREEAEALLAPWFGAGLPEELPAPRLVALTLDETDPPPAGAMETALAEAGLVAEVDDHGRWEADVARAAGAAQALSLAAVTMLAMAAGAVCVFAVQAALAARRDVIEALRVAGASDALIAFLFLRRFFLTGLLSGAAGAALAALALGGLYLFVSEETGLIALPAPGLEEALALAAAPAAAALIGAVTAWLTVIAELGRTVR